MNVSFPFDTETVQFDSNGNPPGWYDIMNYQSLPDGGYNYVQIGNWKNGTLSIPQQPRKMVTSVCSEPCNTDQVKVIRSFSVGYSIGHFKFGGIGHVTCGGRFAAHLKPGPWLNNGRYDMRTYAVVLFAPLTERMWIAHRRVMTSVSKKVLASINLKLSLVAINWHSSAMKDAFVS